MKVFSFLVSVIFIVAAQALEHGYHHEDHYEHGPVEYEFHYGVHDPHTGDIKSQKETRKGDKVEGSYDLIDSDGHKRIVHYKADKHSGFEAVVLREPTNIKIPIPEHHHEYHHQAAAQYHHEEPAHYHHEEPAHLHRSEPAHYFTKVITHPAPIVHHGHRAELHHGYHH